MPAFVPGMSRGVSDPHVDHHCSIDAPAKLCDAWTEHLFAGVFSHEHTDFGANSSANAFTNYHDFYGRKATVDIHCYTSDEYSCNPGILITSKLSCAELCLHQ